jgi:hypothetical protein
MIYSLISCWYCIVFARYGIFQSGNPSARGLHWAMLCRGAGSPNVNWFSVRANRNGIRRTVRPTHRTGSGESYC